MVPTEHNITDKMQRTHVGVLIDRGNSKVFPSAGIRPSFGVGSIQVRFRKSDENCVFHLICIGIPMITTTFSIAAVLRAT